MYLKNSLEADQVENKYEVVVTSISNTETVATFQNVVAGTYFVSLDVDGYGFVKIPYKDTSLFPIKAKLIVEDQGL